jgi:hypothetical protein
LRPLLLSAVLLGSAVAGILTEMFLFRMFTPPDWTAAAIAGLWVAMPHLAAVVLAVLFRRRIAVLLMLLVALVAAAPIGVSLFNASAIGQEAAAQQVRDAVHPGEDPDSGPAGMRKAGADMGAAVSSAFSIMLVVVLPPVQVAVVSIPTLIAFGISALRRGLADRRALANALRTERG